MLEYYAYIRVSTQKQGQKGSSLQEQRSAIEAYAQRHDLVISQVFEERETAAKRGRHVFNRLLKELDRGRARGVIIHKIDRSARNLRDWADLAELIDRGVQVHFAHESLDLNSRGGRLSADIQAVVASDFIRNLRDEVRKGFVGRLKQGFYPLPAPIGYVDHGKAQAKTPHPTMAPLVRQAFELYAGGGYTLETLGVELHSRGIRNRRGGRITRNGWSTLLNNPFYTGLIRIKSTGQVYEGNHQPIVAKDLFRCVQERLAGKARHRGLRHQFVYRRTLRCRRCGKTVIAERQKGYTYYRCHTSACFRGCLREELLNDQVLHAITHVQLDAAEIDALQHEISALTRGDATDIKSAVDATNLAIGKVEERLRRLTDAYLDQTIEKETFEERRGACSPS